MLKFSKPRVIECERFFRERGEFTNFLTGSDSGIEINAPTKDWVMCYPYGAYNTDSIDVIKKLSCSIGITIKPSMAKMGCDSQFELPRFDTNDFPV